jgi:hypothetical protein
VIVSFDRAVDSRLQRFTPSSTKRGLRVISNSSRRKRPVGWPFRLQTRPAGYLPTLFLSTLSGIFRSHTQRGSRMVALWAHT